MSAACFRQAEAQHAHEHIVPQQSDEGRLLSLSTHPPPVERPSTSAVFCTADGMTTTAEWCHLSFFFFFPACPALKSTASLCSLDVGWYE